jgi:DNA-directed RNA polymerase specialized sigma24 family protein
MFTVRMACMPGTPSASHATWDADRRCAEAWPSARCASSKGQNRRVHADELADLLRWCAALSTKPADLAGAVVLAAGPRWSQLVDSPQDMRELTVRTFLRIQEPSETVARQSLERTPDELRTVVLAYDRLPKTQRAVVMLSCLEGITYAEIAGIIDRSAARVGIELDRALAALDADPYEVRAALDIASWQVPAAVDVSRALRRQTRTRTRKRRRMGFAAVTAGTIVAVLVTFSVVHRPYVEPRQSGAWAFSHVVRPTAGWSIQSRTVERDWETTILRADPPDVERCSVSVGAAGANWVRQLPRKPTRVWVGARSAFYAEGVWPNGRGAMLWWEYADTAWVIIECGSLIAPRDALPYLASHVVLTPEPIMLPYRIRSLPRHYQVISITKGLVSNSTVASLARNDYPEGIIQISIRYPAGLPMYGVSNSTLVSRYANGRHAAVCRPFANSHICVRGDLSTPGSIDIAGQRGALAVIDRIASKLELASNPTDPASWFDARDALPS